MTLISKQLRKDSSFNRCDLIMKETIEEFCQCFQTITTSLMNFSSPIRVRYLQKKKKKYSSLQNAYLFSLHHLVVH